MSTAEEVRSQALGLPPGQRASLARDLLLSLETEEFEADTQQAWAREAEERAETLCTRRHCRSPMAESVERIRRS